MSKSKITDAAWARQRAEFARSDKRKDRERTEAVIAAARAVVEAWDAVSEEDYSGDERMRVCIDPATRSALDRLQVLWHSAAVADLDKVK